MKTPPYNLGTQYIFGDVFISDNGVLSRNKDKISTCSFLRLSANDLKWVYGTALWLDRYVMFNDIFRSLDVNSCYHILNFSIELGFQALNNKTSEWLNFVCSRISYIRIFLLLDGLFGYAKYPDRSVNLFIVMESWYARTA